MYIRPLGNWLLRQLRAFSCTQSPSIADCPVPSVGGSGAGCFIFDTISVLAANCFATLIGVF